MVVVAVQPEARLVLVATGKMPRLVQLELVEMAVLAVAVQEEMVVLDLQMALPELPRAVAVEVGEPHHPVQDG
jgi:predicted urease superfamily metal-dependent hydrolase